MRLTHRRTALAIGAISLLPLSGGCHDVEHRPATLLDGTPAGEFSPVRASVLTVARAVRRSVLGTRFSSCFTEAEARRFPADTLVVERIGVESESLTFAGSHGETVQGCDGGTDPAGERASPWCGAPAGRLFEGRLLDPRLDVVCLAAGGQPIAYAWIEPIAGAHWVGVDQGSYTEMYEVLGALPVRIATTRHVRVEGRATFAVTQYGLGGRRLAKTVLEAAVAG